MDILVLLFKTCMCVCVLSCCIYVELSKTNSHELPGAFFWSFPDSFAFYHKVKYINLHRYFRYRAKRKGHTVLKLLVNRGLRGLSSMGDNYSALVQIVNFISKEVAIVWRGSKQVLINAVKLF